MSNPQTIKRAARHIDMLAKLSNEKKIIVSTDLSAREIARKIGDGKITRPSARHLSVTAHGTEVLLGRSTVHPAGSNLASYSVTGQKIDEKFDTWLTNMNRRNRVSIVLAAIMSAMMFNAASTVSGALETTLWLIVAMIFGAVSVFGVITLVTRKRAADKRNSGVNVLQTSIAAPRTIQRASEKSSTEAA